MIQLRTDRDAEGILSPSDIQNSVMELKNRLTDITKEYEKQFIYNTQEVGIKHEKTRSHLKFFDNGNIELFTGGSTAGVLVNKKYQSLNMYGESVNINTPTMRMSTNENSLIWNSHSFNPLMYQLSDKKNPEWWDKNRTYPFPGTAYIDDLKLNGTVRWWCPGVPNLCGRHQEKGETHSGHWVRKDINITPFYWVRQDEEYLKMLKENGIPV